MKETVKKQNVFAFIVLVIIVIIGYWGVQNREEKFKEYKLTKGKVVMHTMTSGDRGQPEIVCKVIINSKEKLINYETKDLKIKIDDCVEIKYSIQDPKINEIVYEKGAVPCD